MADSAVRALHVSVARLRDLASTISDEGLTAPAYPSEWSIADVLSHIGSGAVITQRRLDDTLAGHDTPDEFAPTVWDTWNAKTPTTRRDDALEADSDLLARLEAVSADERAGFRSTMGPLTLGFDAFVGMRLNEHAFHTWDIEVAADPTATIPSEVAALVVDNLELIARYTAKPTGDTTTINIATIEPPRRFTVDLAPDSIAFAPATGTAAADIELTAEALARLIYGRLDPDHTPAGSERPALKVLRQVFPGP